MARSSSSSIRENPLFNRGSRLLGCLLAMLAGCAERASSERGKAIIETDFTTQVAAVRSGESVIIQLEARPLTDEHLAELKDLSPLAILLIDDPKSQISTAGLQHLASLAALTHLRIRSGKIDDACLAQISQIKSLRILNLPRGTFTDAGLVNLKSLPLLEQLRFGSQHVTDAGMATITELPSLKRLHLIDVPITDAGLAELTKIEQLESLYLDGSKVTDAGFDHLFEARPKLHVHIDQHHHDRDPHKHPH